MRHVEVEHDVDLLDIDSTTEDVCGNHDSFLERLELVVPSDPDSTLNLFGLTFLLVRDLGEYRSKGTSPF